MRKILDAALVALLKGLELSPWVKVPATFVAELSKRYKELPEEQQKELIKASPEQIQKTLDESELEVENSAEVTEQIRQHFRIKIVDFLTAIPDSELENIIAKFEGASSHVSTTAPQAAKVKQFIDFAYAPNGPGLHEVAKRLEGF